LNSLVDKLIIFIFCTVIYLPNSSNLSILPLLIVLIIVSLLTVFDNYKTVKVVMLAAYIILCFLYPVYSFFAPSVCYEYILYKINWLWPFALLPVIINFNQYSLFILMLTIIAAAVSVLLKVRTVSLNDYINKSHSLRDDSIETVYRLEIKNKELLEKQDYEINIATLNERNRIARDIHDNVGHMLSSSILQIGALLATVKDENIKENLRSINNTLSKAMDSIRQSVHNLHEQSIDLKYEISTLINNFKFCTVELQYDIQSNADKKLKYCFIAIIKEALSNIIKHSNATQAKIILREHPALYQLIIQDNGTKIANEDKEGLGLKSIADRTAAFGGNFNINKIDGFKLFISIPKIKNNEEV